MNPDKLLDALSAAETAELIAALERRGLVALRPAIAGGAEPASGGRAPFAFVNEGKVARSWGGRDYLGGLRFRPAIVVE